MWEAHDQQDQGHEYLEARVRSREVCRRSPDSTSRGGGEKIDTPAARHISPCTVPAQLCVQTSRTCVAQVIKGCATQNIHTSFLRHVPRLDAFYTKHLYSVLSCSGSSNFKSTAKIADFLPEGGASAEQIWVDTDKFVEPAHSKIRSRVCVREYKTKQQSNIQRASLASQLFSAMPPLEAVKGLVLTMMSVSWWSYKRNPLKVETLRHQPSTFPLNSPETRLYPTSSRRARACMELATN